MIEIANYEQTQVPYFHREPKLVYSRLCRSYKQDGHLLDVQIYRLDDRPNWKLEVVNEAGTSIVWKKKFASERQANEAFYDKLMRDGIEVFLENDDD